MIALVFCVALFATDESQAPYHVQCVEVPAVSEKAFTAAMLASIRPFFPHAEVISHTTGPRTVVLEVVP